MSIRKKVRRLGALGAAAFLAASTLVLPSSTQPAVAQDACTPNPGLPNPLGPWNTLYDDRGVTVCRATDGGDVNTYVQILDLAAGAKLNLAAYSSSPGHQSPDHPGEYLKRDAAAWFDWIPTGTTVGPDPSLLFSTSNASFLIDTSGIATQLPLPHRSKTEFFGPQSVLTYGVALIDHDDPAWDADKRVLRMDDPTTSSTQRVEISDFPTHYTEEDVRDELGLSSAAAACGIGEQCWAGTVAFDPLYQIVDPVARRTMVGIDATNQVYILNSEHFLTLSEAQDILGSFGSIAEIQLDGGNSTQLDINYPGGGSDGFSSGIGREVPDALAVYLAPE